MLNNDGTPQAQRRQSNQNSRLQKTQKVIRTQHMIRDKSNKSFNQSDVSYNILN